MIVEFLHLLGLDVEDSQDGVESNQHEVVVLAGLALEFLEDGDEGVGGELEAALEDAVGDVLEEADPEDEELDGDGFLEEPDNELNDFGLYFLPELDLFDGDAHDGVPVEQGRRTPQHALSPPLQHIHHVLLQFPRGLLQHQAVAPHEVHIGLVDGQEVLHVQVIIDLRRQFLLDG